MNSNDNDFRITLKVTRSSKHSHVKTTQDIKENMQKNQGFDYSVYDAIKLLD
jgi:hypothetical protein